MVPPDIVYCDQCGGASPSGSTACRFCGAALRLPPPAAAVPPTPHPPAPHPPAVPDTSADDPWAALIADDGSADAPDGVEAWADPSGTPWQPEPEPTAVYDPLPAPWSSATATLVETEPDEPRRGLPGWAWATAVVLLGTALGIGAYLLVDRTDDDSVRTSDTSTTSTSSSSSTSTSTSTTSTTTLAVTTLAPTTLPVVPATPPATAPVTGPPTVPGAVTVAPTTPPPTETPTTVAPATVAPATAAPTTAAPATPAPTTAAPTTTIPPPTVPGAAPGDLGIAGVPMSQPACDGQYVTILASIKQTTASAMQYALEHDYPGASYLRSDQACPSLNVGSSDGSPLYRIFVGPFPDPVSACAARAQSTQGAFVKRLSDESPLHAVPCPETV